MITNKSNMATNHFVFPLSVCFEDSSLPVLSNLFYNAVGQRVNIMILPVKFHKTHLRTHQVPIFHTNTILKHYNARRNNQAS